MLKTNFIFYLCAFLLMNFFYAIEASQLIPLAKQNINNYRKELKQETLEEIIVTATRIKIPSKEVGSSITVITGDEIDKMQKSTIHEVLRTVPGLDVIQSGGPGSTARIYMRGAKSEHTLVLMDGVEMNDPISPGRVFDFANLSTDNIERIEIIRGPQSTLYGSDAIGGVINIITKKGRGKPDGFISVEGGSFNTFREKVGFSGGSRWINYSLGLSKYNTNGISAANEKDGNHEKDGYKNDSLSARAGITPNDTFSMDFILRWNSAEFDMDNMGGAGGDDSNNIGESEQFFFRTVANIVMLNDIWEQKLGFSMVDYNRYFRNDTDDNHPDELSKDSYTGKLLKFDWQHNIYLNEKNTLILGIETEEEKGKSKNYFKNHHINHTSTFGEKIARTTGYYIQDHINIWDALSVTLGARLDDHDEFGEKTTYRITSAYTVRETGTKIRGSYGTGFKTPSLYQLYSEYGDKDLDPEESVGWDVGIDQFFFSNKISIGATYFNNELENLIYFDDSKSKYKNISKAVTEGLEFLLSAEVSNNLTLNASYTFTDTEDKRTGKDLLLRPRDKYAINIDYSFSNRSNIGLDVIYIGDRYDTDYSSNLPVRVKLKEYVRVDLAANYDINKNIQIFGRIENIFDEDYEEVKGYGTPGISAYAGLKLKI